MLACACVCVPPPGAIVTTEEKSVNTLAGWQSPAALVTHKRGMCKHTMQNVQHRNLCYCTKLSLFVYWKCIFNLAGHVLLYSILYYCSALVQPLSACTRSVKSILVIVWPVTEAASSAPPSPHTHTPFLAVIFSSFCLAPSAMLLSRPHLQPKMKASGSGLFNTGCRDGFIYQSSNWGRKTLLLVTESRVIT